jgi:hypothetical protein
MIALVRYQLAALLHGQRYLAPLLLFLIALSVLTINDQGPLTGSYAVSAGSLLIAMCWLTVTIVNHEDPVRRAITGVTAGGSGRVLLAEILLSLLAGALLTGVGLVFPIVAGQHVWTGADLAAGLLALLTSVGAGTAVGLLCSRLVVPRPGYSLLLALVVVIALPITPGLPPVNPMLRILSGSRPPQDQLAALGGCLAIAAALLVVCAGCTRLIAVRRD